jgi:hypothetical protein
MPAGSGRYPSGQRGQTVNLLAYAFGGSNPPLPTIVANGFSAARSEGGLIEMGVAPTRPADRRRVAAARYAVVAAGAAASRQCNPHGSFCGNSSAVERQPSKLGVAGSNPVSRSMVHSAHVAQLAEHALGKGEVSGSIPDMGSRYVSPTKRGAQGR